MSIVQPPRRAGDYAAEFHVDDADRARLLFDHAVCFWYDGRHVPAAIVARGALEAGLRSLYHQTYPDATRLPMVAVLIRVLRGAEVFTRPVAKDIKKGWKIGSAIAHGDPVTYTAMARMMRCTGAVVRLAGDVVEGGVQ